MSGGHWNCAGFKIQESLKTIAEDEEVKKRWPKISMLFNGLADIIYNAEDAMDRDISDGLYIPNDKEFDHNIGGRILTLAMKTCLKD